MTNRSNSIEFQIDNFLEHFKRSASKAMDNDWIGNDPTSSCSNSTTKTAASFNRQSSLSTARNRSSCIDISQLGSSKGKIYTST